MSRISVDVSSARIPVLQVGYQGENEVTDVLFDISSWIAEFGEGVAQLRVKRPGNSEEESYVLSLTITDGIALWTVSETDTFNKGNGKVQLSYLVGNIVKKAVIYPYKVGKSIVGADNPVDPFDSWIERSKAWAIGETLYGDAVPETDETYQNNAKYYAEQADILGSAQVVLATEKATLATEKATLATEKATLATEKAAAAAESEAAVNGVSTQLTTRMSAIETEQSVQSARMDTFTSLPAGSTSGDAELVDIRVGADGTTYDTAGNAVRGQIGELKSDLDNLTKVNVTWTKGYRLANGIQVVGGDWYITDYIELSDDILFQLAYTVKNMNTLQAYCTYDKNKNYIKGYKVGSDSFGFVSGITNITDSNVKYIRFCSFDSGGKHSISISNLNGLKLKNKFVKSEYLADKCVTVDKCDFIAHDPKSNYIDTSKIIDGYYIQSDGIPKANSSFAMTDYVEVESGASYYGYHLCNGYCAFYDVDKNYVIGYDNNTFSFPITVPEGCKYARFSTNTDWWADTSQIWLYTKNIKPKEYSVGLSIPTIEEEVNPCEYDGDEICVFRKGLCIGDSLTEGVFNYVDGNTTYYLTDKTKSYPSKLAMLTGLEIVNKGHGGLTSAQWYAAEQNTDLSGFDFCIIQLGVNDSIYNSGWTQESITAFTNIINKVKAENNNIKIYVATIMPAKSYNGTNIDAVSQGIRDLVTTLADDNVILLDMALYAHTNDSDAYNCGHLSELGYYRLAKDYKNYISYHISENLTQYQQIQFVGTEHVYS